MTHGAAQRNIGCAARIFFGRGSIPLVFWKSTAGREWVRERLLELRKIGRDMAKVQFGWPLGEDKHIDSTCESWRTAAPK